MKTLMHICCAPCANRPIAALREEGIELAGFWYNPNIHPLSLIHIYGRHDPSRKQAGSRDKV